MSVYKRFSLCFVASFLLFVVGFGGFLALLWLYDPFWFFHKPIFREITYHSDMRMQAKGIIDNTDFDSIIIGSSMLKNTSPKEAGQKLSGKWINLSIAASDFNERKILLNYAFGRKNIRQIIYSIDNYVSLNGDMKNDDAWQNIYTNDEFINKFKYYFDKKFIKCAVKWSKKAECVGNKKDLESITKFQDKKEIGGFKNWDKWTKNYATQAYKEYEENGFQLNVKSTRKLDFEGQKSYLQKSIIETIKQHPNTEFYLIVPPFSRFFYALFPFDHVHGEGRNGIEIFSEVKEILPYLVNEIAKYKNAKIYGFDTLSYVDDEKNYSDFIHHYLDMNSMQLDAIADGTHILTPQNIDEYLQTMENKIKAYDLTPLINEIKAWETEQNATAKE